MQAAELHPEICPEEEGEPMLETRWAPSAIIMMAVIIIVVFIVFVSVLIYLVI